MDKKTEQVVTVCSCGCGILRITKEWLDCGHIDYDVSLYKNEFWNGKFFRFESFWTRVRSAWLTFWGYDYELFDICLTEEQFEEFKKSINTL